MKCIELVYDKRTNKVRSCNAEIYGMTGLQELLALQRHMRQKHNKEINMNQALDNRAESGQ
jgi:hypothetical protein